MWPQMFKKCTEPKAGTGAVSDVKRGGRSGISVAKARAASEAGIRDSGAPVAGLVPEGVTLGVPPFLTLAPEPRNLWA